MSHDTPWQSLAEYAEEHSPVTGDLPPREALPTLLLNRRDFLRLTGGALAFSALAACSGPPREQIVPWVKAPPEYTPGQPLFYATALPRHGYARGVLVECHEGRPTKIEGNLHHPASLGATDAATQAEIRTLWDANRSRSPLRAGEPAAWSSFVAALTERRHLHQADGGAGLRLLLEPTTSPSLLAQLEALRKMFPGVRWYHHAALDDRNAAAGARLAFGRPLEIYPHLDRADVIVSFDCDFLGDHPDAVRLAAGFARRRDPEQNEGRMNRLYHFECNPSLTGAMADHRHVLRSSEIHAAALALAAELGVGPGAATTLPGPELKRLAEELRASRGRCLLLAGDRQPPEVHALIHTLNAQLGNHGATIDYLPPVRTPVDDLAPLLAEIDAGRVRTLLILGANPCYTAPADAAFEARLRTVPFSAHLGLYGDETARACLWHLPQAHPLETWGDLRATDGTVTLCQPMIAPLFDGRSAQEVIATLLGTPDPAPYFLLRTFWEREWGGVAPPDRRAPPRDEATAITATDPFSQRWIASLQAGVVAGSALPPAAVHARARDPAPPSPSAAGIELNFFPDPTVEDGHLAPNPWLQELPKPITKLTWDNALLLAPRTAARLGLRQGQLAEVRHRGGRLRSPVWIAPGHADEAATLHLGYGRRAGSPVSVGHGFDANLVRHADAPHFDIGASIVGLEEEHAFAVGQGGDRMEGRDLLRRATLAEYREHPHFAAYDRTADEDTGLFPPFPYTGYAWAMAVNLNTCTGCSACVVACQAENNIPTVGKEEVRLGRKMHWLRIDRYYVGPPEAPQTLFQPVPCMQCENAPCEPVCPVEASVHDGEGINVQVYNRCIGTRFCSNNCPYKVRRFNFLQFTQDEPVSNHQRNPDVTVRMRGVMEKCNYCLQRITRARIAAEREARTLRDGEVVTACQAACPTGAILFGDRNDPASAVNARKGLPRDYTLLAELRTRPRTTYQARLTNPAAPPDQAS
jgi:molybdopterin-containing oxidoreductase family iron-sulfur binding subunit